MSVKPLRKLSVVVPVYNEEITITAVVERVLGSDLPDLDLEVIISDDGSTDGIAGEIADIKNQHSTVVRTHTSPTNLGKGAAVRLGMALATDDVIIVQDADLELNPEEYGCLLQPIATAARTSFMDRGSGREPQHPPTHAAREPVPDDADQAYKALPTEVVKSL